MQVQEEDKRNWWNMWLYNFWIFAKYSVEMNSRKLKKYNIMEKKLIILKTHGLNNTSEVGLVILPESFYVKVKILVNGDFDVEFINSTEEQLFSV